MKPPFLLASMIWVAMAISLQGLYPQAIPTENEGVSRSPNVLLTASVESVHYCLGDDLRYTAHLALTLRFTNRGPDRMIMYKAPKPIDITSGVVAKSAKALGQAREETTLEYDTFGERPAISDSARPDHRFAIVPPGKSYRLGGTVAVVVRFKATPALPGTIAQGTHVMSVQVVDWPFRFDDGKRLRARWAEFGILNYDSNASELFGFSIPAVPVLEDCSGGSRKAGGPHNIL